MRVKLNERCQLDGEFYEPGDVVEVSDEIAELNPWMKPTSEPLTKKSAKTKDEKGKE